MAHAWKACWVNSPRGFESPILRPRRARDLHKRRARALRSSGSGAPRAGPVAVRLQFSKRVDTSVLGLVRRCRPSTDASLPRSRWREQPTASAPTLRAVGRQEPVGDLRAGVCVARHSARGRPPGGTGCSLRRCVVTIQLGRAETTVDLMDPSRRLADLCQIRGSPSWRGWWRCRRRPDRPWRVGPPSLTAAGATTEDQRMLPSWDGRTPTATNQRPAQKGSPGCAATQPASRRRQPAVAGCQARPFGS